MGKPEIFMAKAFEQSSGYQQLQNKEKSKLFTFALKLFFISQYYLEKTFTFLNLAGLEP